jgi:hypothetical protein
MLPYHLFDQVVGPTASDVSLMIGSNKDEMTWVLYKDPRFGKYKKAEMRQMIMGDIRNFSIEINEEQVDELANTYRRHRPEFFLPG